MNERIRKLMIEAGYPAPEIARRAHVLAELIVRECAGQVDGWYDDFENECADRKILKHFGIK